MIPTMTEGRHLLSPLLVTIMTITTEDIHLHREVTRETIIIHPRKDAAILNAIHIHLHYPTTINKEAR